VLLGTRGRVIVGELLRRPHQPRFLEPLGQLAGIGAFEVDEDHRVCVVVRRDEEHLRTRVDDERPLADVAVEHELAALVWALPREALSGHLERRLAVERALLRVGQRERELAYVVPRHDRGG
jgi:hypothetical protein